MSHTNIHAKKMRSAFGVQDLDARRDDLEGRI